VGIVGTVIPEPCQVTPDASGVERDFLPEMAMVNPLMGADHQIAGWFHARLSQALVNLLRIFNEPGSAQWIGIVLFLAVIFLVWKRAWPALVTIVVAVPGGMLLNELLKVAVHGHRPFLESWFVDWPGYVSPAGILSARLCFTGQLLLFLLPLMKSKRSQRLSILPAAMLVGFSRIALGAHYLSDVIAAIFVGVLWLMICALLLRPMRCGMVVPVAVVVEEPRPATAVTAFDRTVDSALKL